MGKQLKQDGIEQNKASKFKQVLVSSPKMAAIIRKNEIKVDLVNFLSAIITSKDYINKGNQEQSVSYMTRINRRNCQHTPNTYHQQSKRALETRKIKPTSQPPPISQPVVGAQEQQSV